MIARLGSRPFGNEYPPAAEHAAGPLDQASRNAHLKGLQVAEFFTAGPCPLVLDEDQRVRQRAVSLRGDGDLRHACGMRPIAAFVLATSLLYACGGAEIGESCDSAGSTDDCVDHAVCTNEDGDASRCRVLCKEHEECPVAHSCNGVSGTSLKSCQPDK